MRSSRNGLIGALLIAGFCIAAIPACEDVGRDEAPLEPRASEPQQQEETDQAMPPAQQPPPAAQ